MFRKFSLILTLIFILASLWTISISIVYLYFGIIEKGLFYLFLGATNLLISNYNLKMYRFLNSKH